MNKIDTSQIVDPTSQQPLTGKSLEFLQAGIADAINGLARGLIGSEYSTSVVYVLNGLEKTGTVIANGYVFYNSEVYFVVGDDISAYANVPVLKNYNPIDPAYDPVIFSDGVNKNVHNIRYLKIFDAVSGTGISDYSQLEYRNIEDSIGTPTGFNVAGSSSSNSFGFTYTGKNRTYDVEIYAEMDVSCTYVTNGRLGAQLKIKNLLSAGFYPAYCAVLDNTDTSAGKTRTQRLVATWRKTGIAAGTNLELWIENTQADQLSVGNIYIRANEV